jgi:hypothetical protein
MVDPQVSRKAPGASPLERVERRFSATPGADRWLPFGLVMLGALLLGAACYGALIALSPVKGSGYVFLAGVLLASVGVLWGARPPPAARVGELGVALEGAEEITRVAWHEVKSIRIVGNELLVEGSPQNLALRLGPHGQAARHVIAEAARRIGARVEVASNALDRLPALAPDAGALVPVAGFQVTGRRCMASGTPITFEADASLCQNCGALYHVKHVPESCVACGARIAT